MHCMFENLGNMNDIYCSLCLHAYFHFFLVQAFGILVIPSNKPPAVSLYPLPPPFISFWCVTLINDHLPIQSFKSTFDKLTQSLKN